MAAAVAAFGSIAARPADAQTAKPQFEVASIRPAGPFVRGQRLRTGGPGSDTPGRVTYNRVWLGLLLSEAYGVESDQVTGLDWIHDLSSGGYLFTINATFPPDTTLEQYRLMLQHLLAERFHVVFRRETQGRPGYELVVARGGHKLRTPEEVAAQPQAKAAGSVTGVNHDAEGFPQLPPGTARVSAVITGGGAIRMAMRGTVDDLCHLLGNAINQASGDGSLGRAKPRVVNKTGLDALYEFRLAYAGWVSPPRPSPGGETTPAASDPAESVPTLFTAVEKQLGLKLQKGEDVKVDVLVIERADKTPVEN